MPNPNAFVSSVIRFEPPLDRAPAEMLRAERGLSVELEGGRRVRLDPANPRSVGFIQILDGLSKQRISVYLEVDPATSTVTRVLIPHVTRVVDVKPGEHGLDVELQMSHARHLLRRGTPDFAELERQLREATRKGNVVIVAEDDAHNIIDVRGFTPGTGGPPTPDLPPFPKPKTPKWPWPFNWLRDLWLWRCWPWWWFSFRCMSPARAQQVFDAMAATNCNPLTVPPPCIPFMYPDDGCWGRAHEMCRLMIAMGVSPKKVWIEKSGPYLHANTRNNPQCFVEWNWHVAPTICVRRWRCWCLFSYEAVIDPALFTTPVSKATWKGAQNNPGATLTDSDWTIFYLWGSVTDPTFAQTNVVLATYRAQLQLRSQSSVGPPPYANCP